MDWRFNRGHINSGGGIGSHGQLLFHTTELGILTFAGLDFPIEIAREDVGAPSTGLLPSVIAAFKHGAAVPHAENGSLNQPLLGGAPWSDQLMIGFNFLSGIVLLSFNPWWLGAKTCTAVIQMIR